MMQVEQIINLDQFLEDLHEVKFQFEWTHNELLRGTHKRHYASFCPLTAVVFSKCGVYLGVNEWPQAAEILGIDPTDAQEIAHSADNYLSDMSDKLRKAVGLCMD